MTDITKCDGIGCKKKDKCWRFVAPNGEYQSYTIFNPLKCDWYWPIKAKAKPKKK